MFEPCYSADCQFPAPFLPPTNFCFSTPESHTYPLQNRQKHSLKDILLVCQFRFCWISILKEQVVHKLASHFLIRKPIQIRVSTCHMLAEPEHKHKMPTLSVYQWKAQDQHLGSSGKFGKHQQSLPLISDSDSDFQVDEDSELNMLFRNTSHTAISKCLHDS